MKFGTFKSRNNWRVIMETKRFVYWQDGKMWLGYLEEYPDYMTQGESLAELKENLVDIYNDLTSGVSVFAGQRGMLMK